MCSHFLKIVNLIIVQGVKAAVKTCKPISLYLNAIRLPLIIIVVIDVNNSYTNTLIFNIVVLCCQNDRV